MPDNVSLETIIENQTAYIGEQTTKINSLESENSILLSRLNTLINRVYGYNHEAMVAETLDTVYDGIIEENPDLAELSAVGFTALLRDGDTVLAQGNIMYINGAEEESDYTFSGENSDGGTELVNVWYFENGALNLNAPALFNIFKLNILMKNSAIAIDKSYYDYTSELVTENFDLPAVPIGGKKNKDLFNYEKSNFKISDSAEEFYSTTTVIPKNFTGFSKHSNLKRIILPELIYLGRGINSPDTYSDMGPCCFSGCNNPALTIDFPNVQYINGSTNSDYTVMFEKVEKVEIPESLKVIVRIICKENKIIILNCKDAESISSNWCITTPTERFEMAEDWGASINIATAAANWLKTDFVDLFTDSLRDIDDEVREIKIPSAIYDSLTDEEFALAEDKGWTVGA